MPAENIISRWYDQTKKKMDQTKEIFEEGFRGLSSYLQPNSFLGRRNALKTVIAGHKFGPKKPLEPTYCAVCNNLITFLSVSQCRPCKLTVHRDCAQKVDQRCIRAMSNNDIVDLGHDFQPTTFTRPTFCRHCGTLIMGFHLQGLQCNRSVTSDEEHCKMTIHHGCEEFVCYCCRCDETQRRGSILDDDNNCSNKTSSKISLDQLQILSKLGQGSFSKVYEVKSLTNSKRYAMKVVDKADIVDHHDPKSIQLEWKILNMGRVYPFIAKGSCCFQTDTKLIYLMEYGSGGDLYNQLNKRLIKGLGPFNEDDTRFYAAEIILALCYLHKSNIVYRDLKLENVILDSQGHCKLIDFGSSRILDDNSSMKTTTFCGTQFYLSPEIIEGKPYSFSVDWWSLGVSLYELLFGVLPFPINDANCTNENRIYDIILKTKISYPQPLSCEAKNLLEGLLTKDPEKRLGCVLIESSVQAIKNHPFFKKPVIHNQIVRANLWQAIEAKSIPPPFIPDNENSNDDEDDELINNLDSLSMEGKNGRNQLKTRDFDNFSQYGESFKEDVLLSL